MKLDVKTSPSDLGSKLDFFFQLASEKVKLIHNNYDEKNGSPVFTVNGQYTTRGWTEWTQGFQYGIPLLIFDSNGDTEMLNIGRKNTIQKMAHHLSHFGVHDHGFNNLSTYGNLLRLANQNKFETTSGDRDFYKLALQMSGAVQAKRWSEVKHGGYMYSFNGPHSLFIDTIRTCRILVAAHLLGHRMLEENDQEVNLLDRAMEHGVTTAKYAVYYGEGRDHYDVRGRVAHESIFNMNDGNYRCPNSQQGFSGFTTWTRGLSWAITGFTEFLEFLLQNQSNPSDKTKEAIKVFLKAAKSTCDFYLAHTASDGIPYWDTGAPELYKLGKYQEAPADPYNNFEPVDSSAAAIAAQGLLRLGKILENEAPSEAEKYTEAGFKTLKTLLTDTYLSTSSDHQGILKHSIYHHPNGWDYVPEGSKIPYGESSMWGDYHMVELSLLAKRMLEGKYYRFFDNLV